MWDKKLHACMKKAGCEHLEGSPSFFHDNSQDTECTVYVDHFILVCPPAIDFKDPSEPVARYLGIYHEFFLQQVQQNHCNEEGRHKVPQSRPAALHGGDWG